MTDLMMLTGSSSAGGSRASSISPEPASLRLAEPSSSGLAYLERGSGFVCFFFLSLAHNGPSSLYSWPPYSFSVALFIGRRRRMIFFLMVAISAACFVRVCPSTCVVWWRWWSS